MYRLDLLVNDSWPINSTPTWIIMRDLDRIHIDQPSLVNIGSACSMEQPCHSWVLTPEIHDWMCEQGVTKYTLNYTVCYEDHGYDIGQYNCWIEMDKDVRLLFKLTWFRK